MPLPWELFPSDSCKDSLIFPLQSTGLPSAPWLGSYRGFAVMLTACGMCCAIPVRQLSSCHGGNSITGTFEGEGRTSHLFNGTKLSTQYITKFKNALKVY